MFSTRSEAQRNTNVRRIGIVLSLVMGLAIVGVVALNMDGRESRSVSRNLKPKMMENVAHQVRTRTYYCYIPFPHPCAQEEYEKERELKAERQNAPNLKPKMMEKGDYYCYIPFPHPCAEEELLKEKESRPVAKNAKGDYYCYIPFPHPCAQEEFAKERESRSVSRNEHVSGDTYYCYIPFPHPCAQEEYEKERESRSVSRMEKSNGDAKGDYYCYIPFPHPCAQEEYEKERELKAERQNRPKSDYSCGPNMFFDQCRAYPYCQKTCQNKNQNIPCPYICMPGCICKPGFVLTSTNSGVCIPKAHC